jgi:hypothetical protein
MRIKAHKSLAALAGKALAAGAINSADAALFVYEGFRYSNVGDELQAIASVGVSAAVSDRNSFDAPYF